MCFDYNTIHYYGGQNKEGNEQLLEDQIILQNAGYCKALSHSESLCILSNYFLKIIRCFEGNHHLLNKLLAP